MTISDEAQCRAVRITIYPGDLTGDAGGALWAASGVETLIASVSALPTAPYSPNLFICDSQREWESRRTEFFICKHLKHH